MIKFIKITEIIKIPNFKWTKIISDNSTIAKDVTIGYGTVVISGSIINTGTKIGEHCIINTRATIDHDNEIRDFININPSVVTGGSVIIHDGSEIGIGSTVKNNILINKNVSSSEFAAIRNKRDSGKKPPKLIYPSIQVNIRNGDYGEKESNGKQYIKTPINF